MQYPLKNELLTVCYINVLTVGGQVILYGRNVNLTKSSYEDELNVIAVKYYFDKEEILDQIKPVEDERVQLTVTGDIDIKWWDNITFSGIGTLNIKINDND
jgi:hypothetical protein